MKKLSTFIYSICNFNTAENDLIDLDSILSKNYGKGEFDDVLKLLDKTFAEPKQKVIQNILDFSRNYKA